MVITVQQGIVKFFDETRGYGFIRADSFLQDVFVHVTGIVDDDKHLRIGERVEFVVVEGKRGSQADGVRRIDDRPR